VRSRKVCRSGEKCRLGLSMQSEKNIGKYCNKNSPDCQPLHESLKQVAPQQLPCRADTPGHTCGEAQWSRDRQYVRTVRTQETAAVLKDAESLHQKVKPYFLPLGSSKEIHRTPLGTIQFLCAGLTNGELAAASSKYGLAPVVDQGCPTVGISGLTLGGGLGDLSGRFGAACDSLISADLVTADGRSVTASAMQNPDLFWAIRGGGGNFGIATSFVYQLYPVTEVLHADIEYRFADAREVLRGFRDFMAGAHPTSYSLPHPFPDSRIALSAWVPSTPVI
jgi:FAD binding domain